jgi:hypothetical protein
MRFKGGEQVVPTQKLHAGGPVGSIKKGAKAGWVRAIRGQILLNSNSTSFSSDLQNWISKHDSGPTTWDTEGFKPSTTVLGRVASALKKSKSGLSVTDAAKAGKVDPAYLWRVWSKNLVVSGGKNYTFFDYMTKLGVPRAKYNKMRDSIKAFRDRRNSELRSLEKMLGLPQDGLWQSEMTGPLSHALDHAMGYAVGTHGHGAYDPTPWATTGAAGAATALNPLLAEQARTNALNAEFDKLLGTFTTWGHNYVVRKFKDIGPAEGLTNMRELAKNKTYSGQYNDLLKVEFDRLDKENDPKEQQIEAFLAAVRAGTNVGLQAASSAASVSIDTGASIFDKITADKRWGDIPTTKYDSNSRLYKDVVHLKNLFKFARGGRVPGVGHGDSVPSLLSPGEFVLRRSAATAIAQEQGPAALNYLNNYDRYAAGGYVAASGREYPIVPAAATHGRMRAASRANEHATKVVNYNFNTEVHNPIAEPASVSVQKRVQRVARLGLLAGDDKESHR